MIQHRIFGLAKMSKSRKFKLVVFDLDGVLVDGMGSWKEVHKALGTLEKSEIHGKLFFSGKITFDQWAEMDVELWKGVEINKIRQILNRTKLMPGAKETISTLKKFGFKTAIISGGLELLAERVAKELDIDYCIGNRLLENSGKVCGVEQVVDFEGKGRILERIAKRFDVKCEECVAVGDYINDIPLFKKAGLSIAFNPKDKELEKYADVVIREKDLRKILPYILEEEKKK